MSNLTIQEQERFDSKWVEGERGCHVWTSPLDKDGYGTFYLRRKNRRAPRVAWYALHGEIPKGLVTNHSCRNRACVNVQHLRLLTQVENTMLDSSSVGYVNSQKTHCPNGHPYDMETHWGGKTQRGCSVCYKEKKRRLRAKWRAEDDLSV